MNKEKFIKSIKFKTDLLLFKGETIKKRYESTFNHPFEEFVERYESVREVDPDFFYLEDEITRRVLNAVNEFRFDKNKVKDFDNDKANKIITDINIINNTSIKDRVKKVFDYLNREEMERECEFEEIKQLENVIIYDSSIYNMIDLEIPFETIEVESPVDKIVKQLIIIQAIDNLNKKCPELFEDDTFKNNTVKLIDSLEFESKKAKEKVKTLKKELDISKK